MPWLRGSMRSGLGTDELDCDLWYSVSLIDILIRSVESIEVFPAMNHGGGVDLRDSHKDALPELLPRVHSDVAEKGARHFPE